MAAAAGVTIRPMRVEDVPAAERLSAEGFRELEGRLARRTDPEPRARPADRAEGWVVRTEHLLRTDPGGCWVAEDDDGMVGFATSFVRELMWVLATYAVRPGHQGRGVGRALLDAALSHGRHCLRGMLSSSADPRAVRRYRLAGFTLHPQMSLRGVVDRSAIPVVEGVREAVPGDVDLMDSVDRRTRGAAHGPDHAVLQQAHRAVVVDARTGSGYAYLGHGSVALLAATHRRVAADLLWTALADGVGADGGGDGDTDGDAGPVQQVAHVTAANQWAIDVGLAARLEVRTEGYLALRGLRPPSPYLHHGALL